MKSAHFLHPPTRFLPHTIEREFIGPGIARLASGELLMAAPWGRPPVDFAGREGEIPLPMLYRSADAGSTWAPAGRFDMRWELPGIISDGGISFLWLKDGRLAALFHRHVPGNHGGGLPALSFSPDQGQTWTPARLVDGAPEGVWYVMNDRLVQLASGRLIVPVAHMPQDLGRREGDANVALCFFSDDGGEHWSASSQPASLAGDPRGMAEPAVVELADGRLLMLARTGAGAHWQTHSADSGATWSTPQPTPLTAACSPLTLKRAPDERLMVLYNHAPPLHPGAFFPRRPLVYALSEDEGSRWSEPVLIDDEPGQQHIYPSACFLDEGVLVVYSSHFAREDGRFGGPPDAWQIGGGKCCLLGLEEAG